MAVFGGFSNITKVPELRRRIAFSLGVLAIYRVGVFITIPGVDRSVMQQVVSSQGGLLGMFNMFSGGALAQLSIFALGITPYISASIIMQLQARFGKTIDAQVKLDPTLIGGLKIVIGDTVIDASVRGQLQELAYSLKG